MIKKVNVYPVVPVFALKNPIYSTTLNTKLSTGDILRCIYSRAKVEEILPNGKIIRLDLKNYNTVNYCEQPIEHNNNLEELSNVDESNIGVDVQVGMEPEEATEEDSSLDIPETISPEEEQVEENLVVEHQDRNNRKNKRK